MKPFASTFMVLHTPVFGEPDSASAPMPVLGGGEPPDEVLAAYLTAISEVASEDFGLPVAMAVSSAAADILCRSLPPSVRQAARISLLRTDGSVLVGTVLDNLDRQVFAAWTMGDGSTVGVRFFAEGEGASHVLH